jgi:hypothetical protein
MIYRDYNKEEGNYTSISNNVLLDTRLSFGARGLLASLLSRNAQWKVSLKEIVSNNSVGIKKIRKLMKELVLLGYAKRKFKRNQKCQILGSSYDVYENPIKCPETAQKGFSENRNCPKGHLNKSISIKGNNEDLLNIKEESSAETAQKGFLALELEFEERFWSPYRFKANKKGSFNKWKNMTAKEKDVVCSNLHLYNIHLLLNPWKQKKNPATYLNRGYKEEYEDVNRLLDLSISEDHQYWKYLDWLKNFSKLTGDKNCRVLSASEYNSIMQKKTLTGIATHLPGNYFLDFIHKLHKDLNDNKWAREKYSTVFEAFSTEVKKEIGSL